MNDKKKILIVSGAFYPTISPRSFRTTELSKELARQGHHVTVLIPKADINFNYKDFETKHHIEILSLGSSFWKELSFGKSSIIVLLRKIVSRILSYLIEYPNLQLMFLVKHVLKGLHGFDLLISIAVPYPIHWGVAISRNRNLLYKTWIADCGDPYTGYGRKYFEKMFYLVHLTKYAFNKANYISVPFIGAIKAYPNKYHRKIKIIPQGFNFSEINLHEGNIQHSIPTIAFAGAFIPDRRDIRPFINFLLEYEYEFKLIIYTKQKDFFLQYKNIFGTKLFLCDYIEREKLLYELSKMDFLINLDNRNEIQLPSKIIDYALTKRPILSIDAYNLDRVLIAQFMEGNYQGQLKININDYNINYVALSFLNLL